MSTAEIFSQLSKLPEEQKKSVSDYIAFLIAQSEEENKGKPKPKPVFGSCKGMFKMAPDFDEPLEDFKDYM
jgi:hypothetical protein